jgi:SAM-dependent methyltransferase
VIRPDAAKMKQDHERLDPWRNYGSVSESAYDQFVVRLLSPSVANLVLDAGTGNGRFAEYISNLGCTVVGVDINFSILSTAKRRLQRSKVDLIVGDLSSLPFRNFVFDRILCVHNLWYVRAYEKAVSSMINSLKVDGLMVIDHLNLFAFFGLTYFRRSFSLILRRGICDIGRRRKTILRPFLGRGTFEVSYLSAMKPLIIGRRPVAFAKRFTVAFRRRQTSAEA